MKSLPAEIAASAKYTCPVCGYAGLAEPARNTANAPSYEVCESCGFEFGFDDDAQGVTYEQWRRKWVEGGMQWWAADVDEPEPSGWDPKRQLAALLASGDQPEPPG